MNLHELLLSRRTVHEFTAEPLAAGVLPRALQAAVSAPNHRMTEPWRFLQVGPETRKELLKLGLALKDRADKPLTAATIERLRGKLLRPAELVVVAQHLHNKASIAEEDYAAVACAIQNLMLSLAAEGVGSKWSTGGITSDERSYSLFGLDQTVDRIIGFVWVGHSAESAPTRPRRRRALSEILRQLP